ncbi:prepilin-type N-terminal cleavage/methylation domain-containing protein [uncultured Ilyobacter sp.]|uniref:prepilin-type N-terminal cleavage/methylation domain-containing protein n=1 Tax=uncultured Ilyobacter sp. TaxID=544433 RepID=UPI0029C07DBB|nr:prepilin-type N-terminal cleavage/methylation domain-containing protein [uncultured Ilyobacter sp.]
MKKNKGFILIEVLIALVIFLIGIFPIIHFSVNSLSTGRMTTEIEEGSRLVTTAIDYIKSRGYDYVSDNILSSGYDSSFKKVYKLKYDEAQASYVVDTSGGGEDFENDFYGSSNSVFLLESRGIDLEDATITIVMKKSDVSIIYDKDDDGEYEDEDDYRNPVNNLETKIIFGNNGLLEDQVIYGTVKLEYLSKKDNSLKSKNYEQNFILVPLENWK